MIPGVIQEWRRAALGYRLRGDERTFPNGHPRRSGDRFASWAEVWLWVCDRM